MYNRHVIEIAFSSPNILNARCLLQPASEGASRQSQSVEVMELPSTSDQGSTFTEISGDQQDVQMQTDVQVTVNVNILHFSFKKLKREIDVNGS